jgi:hypothetical protein
MDNFETRSKIELALVIIGFIAAFVMPFIVMASGGA